MKRRRFLVASVGSLVLGGLLLVSSGPGVTPTWAQNPTPQQQQFRQIMDKLDQVLAATKAASAEAESTKSAGHEDIQTMQWDKVLPASQRFVVLAAFNNDAMLDKETGLVWEKSPQSAAVSLPNARLACASKAVGGRKGWRLPALPELASLVDPSVASPGPTLPAGHPFLAVQSAVYWSSTRVGEDPRGSWAVHLGLGGGATFINWAHSVLVWCVHDGMKADRH